MPGQTVITACSGYLLRQGIRGFAPLLPAASRAFPGSRIRFSVPSGLAMDPSTDLLAAGALASFIGRAIAVTAYIDHPLRCSPGSRAAPWLGTSRNRLRPSRAPTTTFYRHQAVSIREWLAVCSPPRSGARQAPGRSSLLRRWAEPDHSRWWYSAASTCSGGAPKATAGRQMRHRTQAPSVKRASPWASDGVSGTGHQLDHQLAAHVPALVRCMALGA